MGNKRNKRTSKPPNKGPKSPPVPASLEPTVAYISDSTQREIFKIVVVLLIAIAVILAIIIYL